MKSIKILISIMLSVCIAFFEPALLVWAEENINTQNENGILSQVSDTLKLSVEYPSDIKCGTPVTFTMKATGGTGNYKYRIAALMDSELANVYDISYGSNSTYGDSNTFTFTFYASGTYYIRFSVMDMTTYQTKMTGLYEYPIVIQDESYPSVEQIVTTVAAQCEAECSTDFEKALWLHDWIINHADYDHSYSYCSAEGVLARGIGTCESYHSAYVKLLNKVGIQTGRMEGNVHVWTAVKMDGEWYQIDSTWDDMGDSYKDTYYEHMYFGLTDEIISLVHDEHTVVPGYESTALEDNYFIKTGEIKQWSDPFIDTIKQNIAGGQTEFVLPVSSSMPDSYKNVIYNLVAYQLSKENWNNVKLSVSYASDQLTCSVKNTNAGAGTGTDTSGGTDAGIGTDTGATIIWTGKQKFVALLYENALGRTAAQSEIDFWTQQLSNGSTGADVAYGFLFSPEFQNKNYNNADYVEHLYLSLMGRASDPSGESGWVTCLNNGASRKCIFKQFINSDEFQNLCNTYEIQKGTVTLTEARDQNYNVTRFVSRNYTQFLGRGYDVEGLNNWCAAINDHTQTMQQIAFGFVFSPECSNKNLSNREYVKMLYRGCFDREGEQAGVNHWTNALDSGTMNRTDVFWGFANSQEFANMVQSYGL